MNQHQLDKLLLVCLLRINTSTCFGRCSSQLLLGVIAYVGCVLTACTQSTHIPPGSKFLFDLGAAS
jgi:hypothetical protein